MNSILQIDKLNIPSDANFVSQGQGAPVVMIHGLAASLHDWDSLIPQLTRRGYASYALDLLGHGESPKPALPSYQMDWLVEHFLTWLEGLQLTEPAVLVGHSLGGYLALEYARRCPSKTRGLVLVDPLYSNAQLPAALRMAYAHPAIGGFFNRRTPEWVIRSIIDITSVFMGHQKGGLHALPAEVRVQTAVDYVRTAPAAYGILKKKLDLTPYLSTITTPSLIIWGEQDRTLAPSSFAALVRRLPRAVGISSATGHVPHQADAEWFNGLVLTFLESLAPRAQPDDRAVHSEFEGGAFH